MRRPLIAAAAAALAVTLLPASGATADEAARGVDIAPPEVGSCHALTFDEGQKATDPDPAVPCDEPHSSITIKNVELSSPDYSDVDGTSRRVSVPCLRALIGYFGDGAKALKMSAYALYTFFPTKSQQDAGATWVRCDVVLAGGSRLMPLPTDGEPQLGALPHPDSIARCRLGENGDYWETVCTRPHALRSTHVFKRPGAYPGVRRIQKWTYDRCVQKLGRSFGYYTWPTPPAWRAGSRFSTCESTKG